jgi:hypothetical protein
MQTHTNEEMLEGFKAAIQKFAYSIAPAIGRTATTVFTNKRHARIMGQDDDLVVEIMLHDDVNPPAAVVTLCNLPELACETLAYVLEHSVKIRTHFVPPPTTS